MSTDPHPGSAQSVRESWPWACLSCGATIYHDGQRCPDCRSSRRLAAVAAIETAEESFGRWIREQSYPSFVSAVTAVASLELALTVLWLQLLNGSVWFV